MFSLYIHSCSFLVLTCVEFPLVFPLYVYCCSFLSTFFFLPLPFRCPSFLLLPTFRRILPPYHTRRSTAMCPTTLQTARTSRSRAPARSRPTTSWSRPGASPPSTCTAAGVCGPPPSPACFTLTRNKELGTTPEEEASKPSAAVPPAFKDF